MYCLILDTSTERSLIALANGQDILFSETLPFGYNNSKNLLPAIETGLKNLALAPGDLTFIAVTCGPGSYTGLRVGAAAAKSLSFALQIPLVGICSLQAFIPAKDGPFTSLIDAKMGGAYILHGEKQNGQISYPSLLPKVVPLKDLDPTNNGIERFVTPNASRVQNKLQDLFPHAGWEWEETAPNTGHLARIACKRYAHGDLSAPGELELIYLRKTQAEIEKEALA